MNSDNDNFDEIVVVAVTPSLDSNHQSLPTPSLFSHIKKAGGILFDNNSNSTTTMVPVSKYYRHERYPKMMPDLKLAESYIPGVFVWIKGMLYGLLSLIGCHFLSFPPNPTSTPFVITFLCKYTTLVPFIFLYYDGIFMKWIRYTNHFTASLFYIDSTSISLDIVLCTFITQLKYINLNCCGIIGNCISLLWTILGCIHIFFGDSYISQKTGHFIVLFILTCLSLLSIFSSSSCSFSVDSTTTTDSAKVIVLPSSSHLTTQGLKNASLPITIVSNTIMTVPYLLRVASYLGVCVVDAYIFRPSLQREKDRVYMFRYGSIMHCCSTILPVSLILFVSVQSYKIYLIFSQNQDDPSSSSDHNHIMVKGGSISSVRQSCPGENIIMKNSKPKLKNPLEHVFRDCNNNNTAAILRSSCSGGSIIPSTTTTFVPFHSTSPFNFSSFNNNPINNATIHQASPASIPSNINSNSGTNTSHMNSATHKGTISDINYNDLDIQEAFRLAKLQYSPESKATV